jgi:diguanylate cyclase (GGDEF)-like protein
MAVSETPFSYYEDEAVRNAHLAAFQQGLRFGVAVGLSEQEKVINNAADFVRYLLHERAESYNRDPITGLLDYKGIEVAYENLTRNQMRRFSDRPSTLLYIDVDKLSDLNEKLSHPGADELLRDMARVFQESVRANDIVGRHAGDQFIIILANAPLQLGIEKAEEIRQKVSELERDSIHPTITIGVDSIHPEFSLDELFVDASIALIDSKRRDERNCVVVVKQ